MPPHMSALLTALILACLPLAAHATPDAPYMRLVQTPGQEALQTAVTTFRGPRGATIDLIAAVHVGDAAYYRALQKRFATYDKLLYELVKPEEMDMATAGRPDGSVSGLQRWIKNMLQLSFQLDEIDYTRGNFVHADIATERLAKHMRENAGGIAAVLVRWSLQDASRITYPDGSLRMGTFELARAWLSADRPRALKLFVAKELVEFGGGLGDLAATGPAAILIGERNQVAVTVAQKLLRQRARHLAIFYGGAHMPDMDKRLRALGFQRGATQWLVAWDLAPSR